MKTSPVSIDGTATESARDAVIVQQRRSHTRTQRLGLGLCFVRMCDLVCVCGCVGFCLCMRHHVAHDAVIIIVIRVQHTFSARVTLMLRYGPVWGVRTIHLVYIHVYVGIWTYRHVYTRMHAWWDGLSGRVTKCALCVLEFPNLTYTQ